MKKSSLGRRPNSVGGPRLTSEFQDRRDVRSGIPVKSRNPSAERSSQALYPSTPSGIPSTARPSRLTTMSTDSLRHSSYGGKTKKDNRPLHEKEWQVQTVQQIQEYLRNDAEGSEILRSCNNIKNMSMNLFFDIFNLFLSKLDRNTPLADRANYLSEIPVILKRLDYKGKMDKSVLQTVNTMHCWPYVLGILQYMYEMVMNLHAFEEGGLDLIYSSDFSQEEGEFSSKSVGEYLIKSYQVQFSGGDPEEIKSYQDMLDNQLLQENGYTDELFLEEEEFKKTFILMERQYAETMAKLNTILSNMEANKELCNVKETEIGTTSGAIEELKKSIKSVKKSIQDSHQEINNIKSEITVKEQIQQKAHEIDVEKRATKEALAQEKALIINLKETVAHEEKYIAIFEEMLFEENLKFSRLKTEMDTALMEYNECLFSMMPLVKDVNKAVILEQPLQLTKEKYEESKRLLKQITETLAKDKKALSEEVSQLKLLQEQRKVRLSQWNEECELNQRELEKSEKSLRQIKQEHNERKAHLTEEVNELDKKIDELKNGNDITKSKCQALEKELSQMKSCYESRKTKLHKIIEINKKKLALRKQVVLENFQKSQEYINKKKKDIDELHSYLNKVRRHFPKK